MSDIEEINRKRLTKTRQETSKKYNAKQEYNLSAIERPSNIQKVRAEVENKKIAEVGEPYMSKPVPEYPNISRVRLNTATILREDAVFRRRQEIEVDLIKEYESSLHDSAEFDEWQERVKSQDEAQRIQEIKQRKQDMERMREEAVKAVLDKVEMNKSIAQSMREEAEEQLKIRTICHEEELLSKRDRVEEIMAVSENARAAVKRVEEENKLRGAAVLKERRQNKKSVASAKQAALEEKQKLIKQIQAMEKVASVRAKRPKEFDPTSSSGVGLLEELSIMELKERRAQLKQQEERNVENKRLEILESKIERERSLRAKVANLQRIRRLAAQEAAETRTSVRETLKTEQLDITRKHDHTILDVTEKMKTKRHVAKEAAKKLAKELKAERRRQHALHASHAAVEHAKWKSVTRATERDIMQRQRAELAEAEYQAALNEKDKRQRRIVRKTEKIEKDRKKNEYDKMQDDMRILSDSTAVHELALKRVQAGSIREF
eukprot:276642_1